MIPGKPSFTAFCVAELHCALFSIIKWRKTLSLEFDNVQLYKIFSRACSRIGGAYGLLRFAPNRIKIFILDNILFYGMPQHYVLRKQHIEKHARIAISNGIMQVVNVGAGFDTLAIRLGKEYSDVSFIEFDHPDSQRVKISALQDNHVAVTDNVHFVPQDLAALDFISVLNQVPSYNFNAKTLFIVEGFTMYLTQAENKTLFDSFKNSTNNTVMILFGVMSRDNKSIKIGDRLINMILSRTSEKYKWAENLDNVSAFLDSCGFVLKHHISYANLQKEIRNNRQLGRLLARNGEDFYMAQSK